MQKLITYFAKASNPNNKKHKLKPIIAYAASAMSFWTLQQFNNQKKD